MSADKYLNFIKDRVDDFDAVVYGDIEEPDIVRFYKCVECAELWKKHINNRSLIKIQADVDFDGIAACKIAYEFNKSFLPNDRLQVCINSKKVHGINEKSVKYYNSTEEGLVIIVDAGTNDVEYIKKMRGDVIVLDHHPVKVNKDELYGETLNGRYVIINNNISNDGKYEAESRMSGAMVVYEFLRYMEKRYKLSMVVENKMMYQWVGMSLITDEISTSNRRNQYYMEQTVHNPDVESSVFQMMRSLNFMGHIDKSFISYKLAPLFNRAIRAGYSSEALDLAIYEPNKVNELAVFKEYQRKIVDSATSDIEEREEYCYKDVTSMNIGINYNGLIASNILAKTRKSTAVFREEGEYIRGSFRGLYSKLDYRGMFEKTMIELGKGEIEYAEGHKPAFGYFVQRKHIEQILEKIGNMERGVDKREYLTGGTIAERGKYHVNDMLQFKKEGRFMQLGIANSKLSNEESIEMLISISDVELEEVKGPKLMLYKIMGNTKAIAFETLVSPEIYVYIEMGNETTVILRNKWANSIESEE